MAQVPQVQFFETAGGGALATAVNNFLATLPVEQNNIVKVKISFAFGAANPYWAVVTYWASP